MNLKHQDYPRETITTIDTLEEGFKYNRSSLGMWGLQTAFLKGSYKVRTTDFQLIKEEGIQHSQFASLVESEYLFTQNNSLKANYCTSSGENILFGKIIEELDAMAGDCSYKYLLKNDDEAAFDPAQRPYYLVTVSVDRVDFMSRISAERDLKLSAYMLFAKGSSLMVKIDCLQRDPG